MAGQNFVPERGQIFENSFMGQGVKNTYSKIDFLKVNPGLFFHADYNFGLRKNKYPLFNAEICHF